MRKYWSNYILKQNFFLKRGGGSCAFCADLQDIKVLSASVVTIALLGDKFEEK